MFTLPDKKLYFACFVLALTIELGIFTLVNIVRLKHSKYHKFNELTLIPYYCILLYTIAFAC